MKKLLFIILLSIFSIGISQAQNYKYIGSTKCKMCHNKSAKGEQYNTWLKGTHSHSMEILKTDRAKEVGEKLNVHDPTLTCTSTYIHVLVNMQRFQRNFFVFRGIHLCVITIHYYQYKYMQVKAQEPIYQKD